MRRDDGAGGGTYAYRAARSDGRVEQGTIDAPSPDAAAAALALRGLWTVDVRLAATRQDRRAPLPAADLALGLRILADLLEAGLPMTRALGVFEELAPAAWRAALPRLRQSVKEGKSLAAALADAPVDIPPLVVGIASAGEAGHGLAASVRRAAEITESIAAMRAAVRAALTYPLVLAVAGAASIGLMVGVVLPKFAAILADLGQTLPPSTRLLVDASRAARAAFVPALAAAVVAAVAVRGWAVTERGRRQLHAALVRIPVLGTVRRASSSARAAFTLSALLDTGVPIRQALAFAARATGDADAEARILDARERIATGQSIAQALGGTGGLTAVAVRLVQAGEQSGRLTGMLAHAAKLEQEHADRITRTAVRLLEPTLVITFAGIVALVAAALLQAVYSVRPV